MASHVDNVPLDSMIVRDGQTLAQVAALRYTEDQLLNLRPIHDMNHAGDADLQAITSVEKATGIESKQPKVHVASVTEEVGSDLDLPLRVSGAGAPEGEFNQQVQVQMPAKKKKKSKSSRKNKKSKSTGFEEYYADPPMTPAEYEEELNDIYHHSRSFIERIQQCIQRYRARRNLDNERAHYFSVYLALGGVETGIKAFTGGLDQDTIDNNTAKEIEQIQATDHIRGGAIKFYDPGNAEHWVVDWEGVVKGFLSSKAPSKWTIEPYYLNGYCGLVRNFLNYILSHSVCPEYTQEILAARNICDLALKEWPLITELYQVLPGSFNKAAKTLYGGFDDEDWPVPETYWYDPENVRRAGRLPKAEAERVFKTAIAFIGTNEHFEKVMGVPACVVDKGKKSMEVIEIVLPSQKTKMMYAGVKDVLGDIGNMLPLGLLKARHWVNPEFNEADVSDDEEEPISPADSIVETLWFEENILQKCFTGMKFHAYVIELSIGIKYIDQILGIYPSFFTYLPIERLANYQEPIYSTRPGPTVDDFDSPGGDEDYNDY